MGEHHPFRLVAGLDEGLDQLQALGELLRLQLRGRLGDLLAQIGRHLLEIERLEHLADRFGADHGGEAVSTERILRLDVLLLAQELAVLERGEARLEHHVVLEVEDALEILQRHVEQEADAARQRLQEPDVRDRRRELDVAHALAPHPRQRHLHAALLADDALVLHALVLAAQALVVLDRPEDARAEQAVALGLEGAIVDRLRLLDLAVRPRENLVGARDRDADLVEDLRRHLRAEKIHYFLVHVFAPFANISRETRTDDRRRIFARLSVRPRSCVILVRSLGRLGSAGAATLLLRVVQVDVEAERAHLLDEHVERLGNARLERVVAAHDRLVHLGAAGHVVRLDRQHLLQRVGGAIGLERPHLHFAEALAAELRLAAQRLLGDEAVRADRARVDLVVHEVVELEDVDVAHRHLAIERLAGAAVMQRHLARVIEPGEIEHLLDVLLLGAVEHRRRDRDAVAEVLAELDELLFLQRLDRLVLAVDLAQGLLQRLRVAALAVVGVDRLADLEPHAGAGPAEMRLEDLPDVHAARHAERVEHDVDRLAVGEERHVLGRHDLRHHALVAVAARHLVAGLDLALHGDEDLDHLHHAGRQLVAALQLLDLVEEALLQALLALLVLFADGLDLGHQLVVRGGEQPPLRARVLFQQGAGNLRFLLEALRTRNALSAFEEVGETAEHVAVENRLLVVAVLGEPLDLLALDRQRALVLVDAVAVEHAHLDDRALHARRHAQRRVAHVRRLLAEDRAQELLFRRHRALALRRDLAAQDVAGVDFRADVDDARLVEVLERLFRHVRDVAGDLLGAELGVARHHLEFLDVDGREHVVLDDALGQEDRVLEVVAVPRHEGDEDVAAERELAEVGRGTVGDDVAARHRVTHLHQRTLVDAGVLVGALELHQPIDVDARLRRVELLGRADNDTGGVDLVDDAGAARRDRGARVAGDHALHAGADERRLGAHERHRLALHVRAHQRAVRVVVLEERNERGRDRHELLRRHVHVVDLVRRDHQHVARVTADHEFVGEAPAVV